MAITVNAPAVKLPFPLARVRRAAEVFLKAQGILQADLSIVFISGKTMRALNRKSLGHDYVTDVVTFNFRDKTSGPVLDGEIYICPGEARRNARMFREPFEREVLRYVAHGILHLLGEKDRAPADKARMRILENDLLALLTYPV